ncbi:nucleoside recognition domain-containing protein [Aminivibrio sp.]|uniref:nucleoside recognition domain-containing protein n=1 Tax=Aminivibrio sp. TaxID=1872489 RepID=UPI00345EE868
MSSGEMMHERKRVTWVSYVALLVAIVIFSGYFAKVTEWWRVFDFTTLLGSFGNIKGAEASFNFRGAGGVGARDGFLFSLSLMPAVVLALGIVSIVEGLGGLAAAEKMMNPLFKPLVGVPGIVGLAFITSLQSTDGAAAMTKQLFDDNEISDKERTIFSQLMFSANATITNYFSSGAALFAFLSVPIIIPLVVQFVFKVFGANLMRIIVNISEKKAVA